MDQACAGVVNYSVCLQHRIGADHIAFDKLLQGVPLPTNRSKLVLDKDCWRPQAGTRNRANVPCLPEWIVLIAGPVFFCEQKMSIGFVWKVHPPVNNVLLTGIQNITQVGMGPLGRQAGFSVYYQGGFY